MVKKIYIKTPANWVAGGVESLFQLADGINKLWGNAITVFDSNSEDPIPEKYKHYNINFLQSIEDKEENFIIYPEVWTEQLYEYKNLQRCIWWLSVDNNHSKFQDFSDNSIIHFYQSNYAYNYLLSKGCKKYLPLYDYISDNYLKQNFNREEKQNIVCYNPAKGLEFTRQLIHLNPEINFVPLINLTEPQIIDLLKKSKVYIDFGHHPGKDRIPREAAYLGNCIITNKQGAANFYNDINIDEKYKIEDPVAASNIIRDCLNNYDNCIKDFKLYMSIISNQKEYILSQLKLYFS